MPRTGPPLPGISLKISNALLKALDRYADTYHEGNRSAAIKHLLERGLRNQK